MAGVVLVVSLITTGLSVTQQLATAQGAGASTLGNSIVSIVESQDQSNANIVNDPPRLPTEAVIRIPDTGETAKAG